MLKYFLIFWIAIIATLLLAPRANAHDSRPLFIEINETTDLAVRLVWKTPPSVPTGQAPRVSLGAPCKTTQDNAATSRPQGLSIYACPDGLDGAPVEISYPLYNPSISTLIRVEFADGQSRSTILEPSRSSWSIPARDSFSGIVKSYFNIGVKHILGGIDHLLFLAGLLYIAGSPRRVLITITGFTIAHSLTIFLVALDVIRVSVPAVEAIIALSIVFLASEIARNNRTTLTWRRPVIVAGGFGLVHGAGFAAGLSEIGLPQTEKIGALIFFNLGVEAGQIAVVALVFACAYLVNRFAKPFIAAIATTVPLQTILAYSLGIVAAYWFVERLAIALA